MFKAQNTWRNLADKHYHTYMVTFTQPTELLKGSFRITSRKHGREATKLFASVERLDLNIVFMAITKTSKGWYIVFSGLTRAQFDSLDSILANL